MRPQKRQSQKADLMRRLLTLALIASGISIPVSFGSLAVGGVAYAGSGKITCTEITGNVNKPTPPGVHIGMCSPKAGAEYKTALIDDYSNTQANLGNLDWNGGAVTTVSNISQTGYAQGSGGVCPANTFFHVDSSGTVTASSTTGIGIPAVGDIVSWKVCVSESGKLSLQYHTKIHL
jgi:hypothetical protein